MANEDDPDDYNLTTELSDDDMSYIYTRYKLLKDDLGDN